MRRSARIRRDHGSVRLFVWGLGLLALVSAAAIVQGYVSGRPLTMWWFVLAGAVFGAFHYHRGSRK